MSDRGLRGAEREFAESGRGEVALVRLRLRVGVVTEDRLRVAANLGSFSALTVLGPFGEKEFDPDPPMLRRNAILRIHAGLLCEFWNSTPATPRRRDLTRTLLDMERLWLAPNPDNVEVMVRAWLTYDDHVHNKDLVYGLWSSEVGRVVESSRAIWLGHQHGARGAQEVYGSLCVSHLVPWLLGHGALRLPRRTS